MREFNTFSPRKILAQHPQAWYKWLRGYEEKFLIDPDHRQWPTQLIGKYEVLHAVEDGIPFVFSGGVCHGIESDGTKKPSTYRNLFNNWLSYELGLPFYDPQLPKGVTYSSHIHGPAEHLASLNSKVDLIVIDSKRLAAVTMLELVEDTQNSSSRRVIWIVNNGEKFAPCGANNPGMRQFHAEEAWKAAKNTREAFLDKLDLNRLLLSDNSPHGNVCVVFDIEQYAREILRGNYERKSVYMINHAQLEIAKLITLFGRALKGEQLFIYFEPFNLTVQSPQNIHLVPRIKDQTDCDETFEKYLEEGNLIRNQILADQIKNPTTKIVYGLEAAKTAFVQFWNEAYPSHQIKR